MQVLAEFVKQKIGSALQSALGLDAALTLSTLPPQIHTVGKHLLCFQQSRSGDRIQIRERKWVPSVKHQRRQKHKPKNCFSHGITLGESLEWPLTDVITQCFP